MSDLFNTPSTGGDGEYFQVKENVGNLVLFSPTEYKEDVQTTFGTKDAVITDVVVFDGDKVEEFQGSMILQGALIGVLKKYAKQGHGKVLGRLARGTAKPNQAPPYILEQPTDADKKTATDWINKNTDPFAI